MLYASWDIGHILWWTYSISLNCRLLDMEISESHFEIPYWLWLKENEKEKSLIGKYVHNVLDYLIFHWHNDFKGQEYNKQVNCAYFIWRSPKGWQGEAAFSHAVFSSRNWKS